MNPVQDLEAAILQKIRKMPFEDVLKFLNGGPTPARRASVTPSGRQPRANPEDVLDRILATLADHPDGLRMDQIKDATGIAVRTLWRAANLGLAAMKLIKTGNKRGTTYMLPGGKPVPPAQAELPVLAPPKRPTSGPGAVHRRPKR